MPQLMRPATASPSPPLPQARASVAGSTQEGSKPMPFGMRQALAAAVAFVLGPAAPRSFPPPSLMPVIFTSGSPGRRRGAPGGPERDIICLSRQMLRNVQRAAAGEELLQQTPRAAAARLPRRPLLVHSAAGCALGGHGARLTAPTADGVFWRRAHVCSS
jgi:hypothetical protein